MLVQYLVEQRQANYESMDNISPEDKIKFARLQGENKILTDIIDLPQNLKQYKELEKGASEKE